MDEMIPEIRRYGMMPIFGALHWSCEHLIGREVATSASRTTGIGTTGLLLLLLLLLNGTLAVLIEQDIALQWNDILRLVLRLLLLLQLSIGLLLLLLMLLLKDGSHLTDLVALVRSTWGLTGHGESSPWTNVGSIASGIGKDIVHHLIRGNHHPNGSLRLIGTQWHTSHPADHPRATGLSARLLTWHSTGNLGRHLDLATHRIRSRRRRTLNLISSTELIELAWHLT